VEADGEQPDEAELELSEKYAALREQFAVGTRWRIDAAGSVLSTAGGVLGFSVNGAVKTGGHSKKLEIKCKRYGSALIIRIINKYLIRTQRA
jgi:hypothetical protein